MNTESLKKVALAVRCLSMDAVEAADSGHPGMPLGMADLGAVLYGQILSHDPSSPRWLNRDRFALSAGHGSMWLYSLLYLSGYGLTLDDLKSFRQIGSLTPGHPEYGHTVGVETTTGPLGAGFSNAVGMAIAESMLNERFACEEFSPIDHFTYSLVGDGCMMEGVTSEAASLAGSLGLGKLIVFYDSNDITIEGSTTLAFTEDVRKRFEAYGWQTLVGDAYDYDVMTALISQAKNEREKPTLIILKSIIGYGSPNRAGTAGVHGSPLGAEEIKATKENLGVGNCEAFSIPTEALSLMKDRGVELKATREAWERSLLAWRVNHQDLSKEWDQLFDGCADAVKKAVLPAYAVGDKQATRVAGGKTLNAFASVTPCLIGGSADLSPSTNTYMIGLGDYSKDNRRGRNIHFGVREHAMGGVMNGLVLHGPYRSFGSTFLVFSDYMRPTVRLAALMKIPTIFVFTHDSFYVGEDGPTHQPIEQVESLRLIPNLHVLRPADAQETEWAWSYALKRTNGPVVIALSRQALEVFVKPDDWQKSADLGAYVAKDCTGEPDTVVFATGSEVSLAIQAAGLSDKRVRVVSVTCRELMLARGPAFMSALTAGGKAHTVAVEAGVGSGWRGIAKTVHSVDDFGMSGKASDVAKALGFTPEHIATLF